ncbi:MAG: enoyl-CoA hydratase/isomerase family protein [Novosphingobium sp.]
MTEPRVLRHDEDGLCTLTLNRPAKLNALDGQIFAELDAHLAALETQSDTIGCVVLRGAGRGFCSGADLTDIAGSTVTSKPKIIDRLAALPQPTIAAIHGVCFTGALELALACDFIIADCTARFADTHGKWGLVGAWGMIQRLPRRIGTPAAKRMMLTARTVEIDEAAALRLVDQVAEAGELNALIAQLAAAILTNSWHTNLHTKRILRETEAMPLAQALDFEEARYPGYAPDYAVRVAAFRNRRDPGNQ